MRHPGVIILAAGGSTRMGAPKQLLKWGAESLLQRACRTALETSGRPVIVVLGSDAEACLHSIGGLAVKPVINEKWAAGMGSSIKAGLATLLSLDENCSGALFMLADQPTITSQFLAKLVDHWSPTRWPIAAASYGASGGVPALFDRSLFGSLTELDDDCGARKLIGQKLAHTALVDSGTAPLDIDTPDDYQQHAPK